jgi:hypothetical protein
MQEVSGSIPLSSTKSFHEMLVEKKRPEALFVVAIAIAAHFP